MSAARASGAMAEREGIEPPHGFPWPPDSNRAPCQLGHLSAMVGPAGVRTRTVRILRAPPLPIGLRTHGAEGGIRTRSLQTLDLVPLPIGLLPRGAAPRIRTETVQLLRLAPPTSWARAASLVGVQGVEPCGPKRRLYRPPRLRNGLGPRFKERGGRWRSRTPAGSSPAPRFSRPLAVPHSGTFPKRQTPEKRKASRGRLAGEAWFARADEVDAPTRSAPWPWPARGNSG